jgi:hypothetical protein
MIRYSAFVKYLRKSGNARDSTSSVYSLQECLAYCLLALDTHETIELIKTCLNVTVNSG